MESSTAPSKNLSLRNWFLDVNKKDVPPILLLDGGVSTHLNTYSEFSHRSLWSSSLLLTEEGCKHIVQGHLDWLQAGSNILSTVTYQCNYTAIVAPDKSQNHDRLTRCLKEGVALAQRACREYSLQHETRLLYVMASTGCYGASLADGSEYTGAYPSSMTRDDLVAYHRRQVTTLLSQHPDGLAFETIPNQLECSAICDLLQELSDTTVACWISFACGNGTDLNDGTPLSQALDIIQAADPESRYIAAVGINCFSIDHLPSLLNILVSKLVEQPQQTPRGIVIYPNSGEEWDATTETWKEGTGYAAEEWVDRLVSAVGIIYDTWNATAATKARSSPRIVLGGCCRTRPSTIVRLRNRVDERLKAATIM